MNWAFTYRKKSGHKTKKRLLNWRDQKNKLWDKTMKKDIPLGRGSSIRGGVVIRIRREVKRMSNRSRCGSSNERWCPIGRNDRNNRRLLGLWDRLVVDAPVVDDMGNRPVGTLCVLWSGIGHWWVGCSRHGEWVVCSLDEKHRRVKRKHLVGKMNIEFTSKMKNTYKY